MIAIRLSLEESMQRAPGLQTLVLEVTESDLAQSGKAVGTGGAAVGTSGVAGGTSGAGLLGMRERVEAHGGELTVQINEAGGLSLHARLPVAQRA
jgi:signal transduction histidine kinase